MASGIDWVNNWWPAPAKLNLVLNIVGRRADGYHDIQTVFQLIAVSDWLNFRFNNEGEVGLSCGSMVGDIEGNLVMKAARLLKADSGTSKGASIVLKKTLPMGAGLGGGSSDAATTLVILNELWDLKYSKDQLARLGATLGADVPVFVIGKSAWAEGKGEVITALELPPKWFVVVNSSIHCSTKDVFNHNCLTRDSSAITICDFLGGQNNNDCFAAVMEMEEELAKVYKQFSLFGEVFLTGTGSSLFAVCETRQEAVALSEQLPNQWDKWVVEGVNESPLHKALNLSFG